MFGANYALDQSAIEATQNGQPICVEITVINYGTGFKTPTVAPHPHTLSP